MAKQVHTVSIASLGKWFAAVSILLGSVLVISSLLMRQDSLLVDKTWATFKATQSEKARALNSLYEELGYGGMIHNFKNYILRHDEKHLRKAEERIGAAKSALRHLRIFMDQSEEIKALNYVEETVNQYSASLKTAQEMIIDKRPILAIDRAVKVNDGSAYYGFGILDRAVSQEGLDEMALGKPILLQKLLRAFGYGGMIHHFKNYILRAEATLYPKLQDSVNQARNLINDYRKLTINKAETEALRHIEHVLLSYEGNAPHVKVMTMNQATPQTIDRQVKINDEPALAGFQTLTRAIIDENHTASQNVEAAVERIHDLARYMIWGGLLLFPAMIILSNWVLRSKVITPISNITGVMRKLSNDQLDTPLHLDENPNTELGMMGRTVRLFKEHALERKKAEKRVAERERWFRALLESAPDATIIVNDKGIMELANKQAENHFGYSKQELLGENVDMLVPQAVRANHHKQRESFNNKSGFREMGTNLVLSGERKDGSSFPIEVSLSPIMTEEGRFIAAAIRDITEKKKAEKRLKDAYDVITSSINYAARIQRATLPDNVAMQDHLNDHFIIWEPRDTVGGDFYWSKEWGSGLLLMLGDCTGHGVPGAFMTLLSTGALEQALINTPCGNLTLLIQDMHKLLQSTLGQNLDHVGDSDDGLEMGACFISPQDQTLYYVGAHFTLYRLQNGELIEFKGTREAMGYRSIPYDQHYTLHELALEKDCEYYLCTDGLIDQIGETSGRSFGRKRLKTILSEINGRPMNEQKEIIEKRFAQFQGNQKRRDDVSLLGFKI
ncbi:hypothetical protein MTBPR1_40098 [Candidatus Terasakiella magnetica]|uniref:PAS domain S-box protein n=1 Tax=Candidatus Terasakiella magnetica TaxID=1867952 RepID=A0A1C3RIJ8_9PROT|nr:PAS domain S-box protein [Candidatus Terasakiella magnetica]SCA57075.1 hypothetical protein MTBPR1_40098 [Candidatus Terasakiella magnetica]